jgi:hypothetical protein
VDPPVVVDPPKPADPVAPAGPVLAEPVQTIPVLVSQNG